MFDQSTYANLRDVSALRSPSRRQSHLCCSICACYDNSLACTMAAYPGCGRMQLSACTSSSSWCAGLACIRLNATLCWSSQIITEATPVCVYDCQEVEKNGQQFNEDCFDGEKSAPGNKPTYVDYGAPSKLTETTWGG